MKSMVLPTQSKCSSGMRQFVAAAKANHSFTIADTDTVAQRLLEFTGFYPWSFRGFENPDDVRPDFPTAFPGFLVGEVGPSRHNQGPMTDTGIHTGEAFPMG